MKLYKLTDENGCTRNSTQWGENVTHSGTGRGGDLCSASYIHAYEHPIIALLLNPIHANFKNPRLWLADGDVATRYGQLKCGCVSLTTIRELPVPEITTNQRVEFAIRCALAVYNESSFVEWASQWLDGTDRSTQAARAAEVAARAAAAAEVAARAAAAAAAAVWAAARAAAEAAEAAVWAAAEAAARAAARAAAEAAQIDLFVIADAVCGIYNADTNQ